MTLTRDERRRLDVLRRRLQYLEVRIDRSPSELSFDRAEASALKWAIIKIIEGEDSHGTRSEGRTGPNAGRNGA